MIIDCISDLHGHYPKLDAGDLLIVAGDLTKSDTAGQFVQFFIWLSEQPYRKKIVISGNHDNILQEIPPIPDSLPESISYLCDSGTEFEYYDPRFPLEDEGFLPSGKRTLKIWGSPWTLRFDGMNPHCIAFTIDTEEELAEKWALIPDDVDILVTHGPPWQIRDEVETYPEGRFNSALFDNIGSKSLIEITIKKQPLLHVFGHVHGGYGRENYEGCIYVNASHVNELYEPVNKPIRITL